ncbi:MAG: 50S ribosomal protein L29 [bacterium]|nr:50S ribosomal protein L29 [bacterium]
MDIKTIREKSDAEIVTLLDEYRTKLEELRFRVRARELKNVHELQHTRRAIARMLTVRNERTRVVASPV